ncbi:methyltransferase domain-containing protein [Neoroseomonas oryzicola]|uniref:RsmB/NOP family class I SAM-dependent RNA methyltransferase n=1 Tax=Neoroseomonas oryzicola TaxID=535904 RepID=A0A9X9WDC6_9PROT|nr:RsmB/NOP family class I SAM-dependent RNA methyltransferase [Neoroseomonas oryzicola]NKE18501.1 RsmB/NOP family class I SAM-dependent RNA methyltransferase [Neoroseomonas oryzicola]
MTPSARIAAAIDLLAALEEQCFAPNARRRPADAVASDFFRARRFIGGGDRRAVSELAWGVVRQRLRLDWHLARIGMAPTPRLLVLAQMVLAAGADDHGRTRQAAEAAFDGSRYGPAALDAGERRAAASLAGRPLIDAAMPDHARLNLPEWVMPAFAARFGARLPQEAAALEAEAPLDLRANLLRTTREAAATMLAGEGLATEPTPFSPWGLRLPSRRPVTGTKAYKDGLIEVQDEGSQLIALLADARPGMRVADYCAGAAGKTLAMAATMGNRGRITACDTSAPRLEGAAKRLRRAGVDNAERHLLVPGDRWAKRRAGSFDRVLVDAPCTGTGTWRRNPDARLRTRPEDLAELVAVQHEILATASELVRPGGRLVYATCSLLLQENEEQMERFLARDPRFRPVPLDGLWAALMPGAAAPCAGPWLALSPGAQGTDGFFCAVLERAT